jgi:hypothetical protein
VFRTALLKARNRAESKSSTARIRSTCDLGGH